MANQMNVEWTKTANVNLYSNSSETHCILKEQYTPNSDRNHSVTPIEQDYKNAFEFFSSSARKNCSDAQLALIRICYEDYSHIGKVKIFF
jgi:hypothetical protein